MIQLIDFLLTCAVVWGPYIDYSSSAVGHECEMWQYLQCMFTSACGHIVYNNAFIRGYTWT